MPRFETEAERITVFRVGEEYLFRHFFDRADVFEALRDYYNHEAYRFEIPAAAFGPVRDRLTEEYFEPVVIDDLEAYCVVKEKYTKHADILRNSVAHWERRGFLFFLMKDELSVEQAVEKGATPIEETDLVLGI